MSKRHAEDDNDGPNKRRKPNPPDSIIDDMEQRMATVDKALRDQPGIPRAIQEIPRSLLEDNTSGNKVSVELERFKKHCGIVSRRVSAETEKLVEDEEQESAWARLDAIKLDLEKLIQLADQFIESLFTKAAPPSYAHASVWRVEQSGPQPILCLRPTEKHGLPLTLLHSVFFRFHQLCLQPLPRSSAAGDALRVALALCNSMGESFEDEEDRSVEFDKAMGDFLPCTEGASKIEGRRVKGRAARIFDAGGHRIIIREDKVEMGTGDAYTQISRSFDLACEEQGKNRIVPNAPTFLLCVMGPSLIIAGGFKDHADTVVEPLCSMLLMLKDMDTVNGRVKKLAIHLFALRTCMEELQGLPNPSSPSSGLPRVFQSFQDDQGAPRKLTFQRRLSNDSLLFTAFDDMSRELCVKIIYGPYGEQVHRALASKRMAPGLLGVSRIEGGPSIIIMERLNKSWQTLHDFAQRNSRWIVNGVQAAIRQRLEDIVNTLEEHGLVHGDFRTNNIMVKQGEEESAVVIDFDWSGKAGEVYYPFDRNHSGITWSSKVDSVIDLPHDREMLKSQWNTLPQIS